MAMPYMGHNIHNLYYRNTFFRQKRHKKTRMHKNFQFRWEKSRDQSPLFPLPESYSHPRIVWLLADALWPII